MIEEKPIEIDEEKHIENKEENNAEPKPMDETEWICEYCNQTNFIIYDDIMTSRCTNIKCLSTNDNIREILYAYRE